MGQAHGFLLEQQYIILRIWLLGDSGLLGVYGDQTAQKLSTIGRIVKEPYRTYHQNEYLLHLSVLDITSEKKKTPTSQPTSTLPLKWIANCDDAII